MARPAVYALDLGSTRFKLARLQTDGRLGEIHSEPAPKLRGAGLIREAEAQNFLRAADALLDRIEAPHDAALGLVSQRSTFCLWDARTSRAITPMISWQDRRADEWCARHARLESTLRAITGLPLSPHYVGPKLASMQSESAQFAARLASPATRFGTLDTWLLWHWTDGRAHATDLGMGARTMLVDIERKAWSPEALSVFSVARRVLPTLRPSVAEPIQLGSGLLLTASLADQSAGTIAVLEPDDRAALINFGTGAFVLVPTGSRARMQTGYLTAPLIATADGVRFANEGTVNGAGPALDRFGSGPTRWPAVDPNPGAFAIPDLSGIGSPHWRADISLRFSDDAEALDNSARRRIVLEGLLFRVWEILNGIGDGVPERLVISGGLVRDPAVADGLAALADRPVEVLEEPEATLLGTARLAAGLSACSRPRVRRVVPGAAGEYLAAKFPRWRDWLENELSG